MRRVTRTAWTCLLFLAALPALAVALLPPPARAATPAPLLPSPPATTPAPSPPPAREAPVPAVARGWPVGVRPPVLRGWEPPATVYGPGHRGVDLAAPPGSAVRVVAPGRVSFAGRVGGRGVVSVTLTGTDLRTTYEPVTPSVKEGDAVGAGEVVGTLEDTGSHCGRTTCLHWGLLRGETYLNPLTLLPPWLLNTGPSRLLPVLSK
ncbi:M23 family metallopeptidase [Streptomyces sp. L2]|uniref:murein hydrolase activator EnvC family protein n=1 Tax=Streptomyces sp. L2 TaxID=2162665 RepID=UPI001012E866|nr:M23 family metallopeptidase [Streptomyces sp. L2]